VLPILGCVLGCPECGEQTGSPRAPWSILGIGVRQMRSAVPSVG